MGGWRDPAPVGGARHPPLDPGTLARQNMPIPRPVSGAPLPDSDFISWYIQLHTSPRDRGLIKLALPLALICEAANNKWNSDRSGQWRIIPETVIDSLWSAPGGTGLYSAVYRNGAEQVLAFAGTNDAADFIFDDLPDLGAGSPQEAQALLQAQGILTNDVYHPGTVVGHSLGGNLALLVSVAFGFPCFTFNPAVLSGFWDQAVRLFHAQPHPGQITNFVLAADLINPLTEALSGGVNLGYTVRVPVPYHWHPSILGGHYIATMIEAMSELVALT